MASKFQIPIAFKSDPRGIQQAESALSGFGNKLLGVGALVAGAFAIRGLVNFAQEAVLGAERAQQFNNILVQVAKTTNAFGSNLTAGTSRLIKFADAHELVIGVEAELIKEAQAVLLSFKAVGDSAGTVGGTFDRATKAAFDMAAVLKTDARSSAVQLGKALENPVKGVTALAKAGTTFTDQQKEQIRIMVESNDLLGAQELILTEVESQYGGAAEAAALGSERIRLAFGQVQDALGDALAPAFERFTVFFIEEVVPPLTKFFEDDFPVMLRKFGAVASGLSESLAPIGEALREAFNIPDNVSVLESLLDSIANLPDNPLFMELVQAIVELTPALLDLLPPLTELVIELIPLFILLAPTLIGLAKGIADIFAIMAGSLERAVFHTDNFASEARELIGVTLESIPIVGAWVELFNDIFDAIDRAVKRLADYMRDVRGVPSRLNFPVPSTTGARAVGGPVSAMSSYMVGERGPEMFTPGAGGFITPNNRLAGGNSTNITINVNAGMGTNGTQLGADIVSAIKRYERSSGPVFASA